MQPKCVLAGYSALTELRTAQRRRSDFETDVFQGNTLREAYSLKVDRETMTQNDIDLGILSTSSALPRSSPPGS